MLKLSKKLNTYRNALPKSIVVFFILIGLANVVMPLVLNQQRAVETQIQKFSTIIEAIPTENNLLNAATQEGMNQQFVSEDTAIFMNQTYIGINKSDLLQNTLIINGEEATLVIEGATFYTKFAEVMTIEREHIIYTIQYLADQMMTSAYISGITKGIFIEIIFVSILLMILYFALHKTERYSAMLRKILPLLGIIYSITASIYMAVDLPYISFYILTHVLAVYFCLTLYWDKYISLYFLGRNGEYGG